MDSATFRCALPVGEQYDSRRKAASRPGRGAQPTPLPVSLCPFSTDPKIEQVLLVNSSQEGCLSTPNPVPPEVPILQQMRATLRILQDQLTRADFQRGTAIRAANRFRVLLSKIYGSDSPQIARLPLIRPDDRSIDVRPELARRLDLGLSIVGTLDSMAGLSTGGQRVFIGHGRSPLWRVLKDFVQDRLRLPWDEFNREVVAGLGTSERLQAMLNSASFAFLVLTAEDEHADATVHARPNVIHEVGLFQGKLGLRRAIVLLEDGCSEFSNISGLGQIQFPRGNIAAAFEDIRLVLERERII